VASPWWPRRTPSAFRLIARRLRESLDKRPKAERDSLPGRTWRAIHLSVRTSLVMLAADQKGDPRAIAMQPWESFSAGDQAAIAAVARSFRDELKHCAALW
jgi:hypothetical protein